MGNTSEFANWHLSDLGFYPPRSQSQELGAKLNLTGTNSQLFRQDLGSLS